MINNYFPYNLIFIYFIININIIFLYFYILLLIFIINFINNCLNILKIFFLNKQIYIIV